MQKENPQEQMKKILKIFLSSWLKEHRFSGVFPKYKRFSEASIDLLFFNFSETTDAFRIIAASCPVEGIYLPNGGYIPGDKITIWDLHSHCQSQLFSFAALPNTVAEFFKQKKNFPPDALSMNFLKNYQTAQSKNIFNENAFKAIHFLQNEAHHWWQDQHQKFKFTRKKHSPPSK